MEFNLGERLQPAMVANLMPNRSVNADAQSRSADLPRRSMVAGYVRRYVASDA